VHAVFTGADAAELKGQGTGVPMPGRDGKPIIVPPFLPFARDRVRYVGHEVALVVAASAAIAEHAAELVLVDYEDVPAITSVTAAAQPGAAVIHDMAPGNLVFDWAYGDEAATAAIMASAPHKVALRVVSPRVSGVCMEPRAMEPRAASDYRMRILFYIRGRMCMEPRDAREASRASAPGTRRVAWQRVQRHSPRTGAAHSAESHRIPGPGPSASC
jgi:carbon-monoxide dehydrogenase large subunit